MRTEKATKYYQAGMIHFRNGKLSSAENAFKKALKLDPDHADTHNDLGNLYQQRGRLKESYNAYRKALKIAPNHPLLLNNVGNVLMLQGEFENALNWLNKAVTQDPDCAAAHSNLGSTLQCLGENTRAVIAFRRAIELDPHHSLYFCNLGGILIDLEALDEAVDCYNQALRVNPEDQRAYLGLGKAWNALGDLDQAVSSYQKAISIDPANAKCYSGLGRVFEDHGEVDKAVASVQKAIKIDPGSVTAYQILARNKKFKKHDAEIKAMESLFSLKGISDIKRSHLAFSLGKAYEDLGEFDKSMEFILGATQLRRSLFDYSISESEMQFDKIKKVFSPDFFAEYSDCGVSDRTPIFIVGMPRSGTTLVEQILASHPAVYGAGELKDLAKVYQSIDKISGISQDDTFPEYLIGLESEAFAILGEEYVKRIRKYSPDSRFITDKLTHNFLRVGFIRVILPNARIINCTRNPFDNCLSLLKTDFQKGHPYSYEMSELGEYYKLYLGLMDYWRTALPGFIYDQNYEELVSNQEEQTHLLLQHCGLPWDDSCMTFHKTRRKIATASNAQVNRPIYQDSVNLWIHYEKYLEPLISTLKE